MPVQQVEINRKDPGQKYYLDLWESLCKEALRLSAMGFILKRMDNMPVEIFQDEAGTIVSLTLIDNPREKIQYHFHILPGEEEVAILWKFTPDKIPLTVGEQYALLP